MRQNQGYNGFILNLAVKNVNLRATVWAFTMKLSIPEPFQNAVFAVVYREKTTADAWDNVWALGRALNNVLVYERYCFGYW